MSDRKRGYLELVIVVILFLAIVFYFNWPKEIIGVVGVVVIFSIIIFEVFIFRKS